MAKQPGDVLRFVAMIRKRTGIYPRVFDEGSRVVSSLQAWKGAKSKGKRKRERERERRKIKSKKLIEFYRGPVYPRPHIHASTSYGNTQRGLRMCAGTACGKARGTVVCVFSSRLAEHTYGGHFRCDGVINGN